MGEQRVQRSLGGVQCRRGSLPVDGARTSPATGWPGSGLGPALMSAGVPTHTVGSAPVFGDYPRLSSGSTICYKDSQNSSKLLH